MDPSSFTEEDRLFPVYCIDCRKQLPRALSAQNGGRCADCIAADQVARQLAAQQAQAMLAQQAALKQQQAGQVYYANTGMGQCPQCGSTNIFQFNTHDGGNPTATGCACCAGCFFWPLLLLAPFGFSRRTGTSRQCRYCGNRWPV